MHPYPHTYVAAASGRTQGPVVVSSAQLPDLESAPPPQFDGPVGLWSPETLLCASIADCFVLTFRAVCRAAHYEWSNLEVHVEGVLERVDRIAQFTRFTTIAHLRIAPGSDAGKARELLERAEQGCLVANSLKAVRTLDVRIDVTGAAGPGTVT